MSIPVSKSEGVKGWVPHFSSDVPEKQVLYEIVKHDGISIAEALENANRKGVNRTAAQLLCEIALKKGVRITEVQARAIIMEHKNQTEKQIAPGSNMDYLLEAEDKKFHPSSYIMRDGGLVKERDLKHKYLMNGYRKLLAESLKGRVTQNTIVTDFCNWISGLYKSVVSYLFSNNGSTPRSLTISQQIERENRRMANLENS